MNPEEETMSYCRPLPALLALAALLLAGCAAPKADTSLQLAPLAEMPPEVRQAPVSVQEAYRFAAANPQILEQIPCYCGCGPVGHGHNLHCYLAGFDPDGRPVFDDHALG
jgi:hypothetical protein